MEGWVDLGSLIADRPGIDPWLLDRMSDALTITSLSHHQADWFQSQWFSTLRIFLSFFQIKTTHPSEHTHLISIQLQFMLHLHWPSFTATNQTTFYKTCLYFTFNFNDNPLPLKYVKTYPRNLTIAVLWNHIYHLHTTCPKQQNLSSSSSSSPLPISGSSFSTAIAGINPPAVPVQLVKQMMHLPYRNFPHSNTLLMHPFMETCTRSS